MENSQEDIFKILIATDNHLGYGENNPNIENDSFVTFEEILLIANKENVDFILLGGDLFHETRPSPYCINKCIELIRKYCLGDKCVEIEVVSDSSLNFHRNALVNYEDPNMNVSIPIFSIHGNHDDPTGKKQISALDLMASMGLINYFGRWDDVSQVDVNPVLLRKGQSHLALYGLSHLRDERLARLFLSKKVKMKTPPNVKDWFNMMILHQNRANRGVKNFIAETCIPKFMDLVMWGHEHDCYIDAKTLQGGATFITQPGSSVATSLAEGEARTKHVGLLRVHGKKFHITPIELRTVRPFIFKNMVLDPPEVGGLIGKLTHAEKAKRLIKKEVEVMIQQAKQLGRTNNLNPLIRLVVKYDDERQVFNSIRFGQEFTEQVANPEDMVKFVPLHRKTRTKVTIGSMDDVDDDEQVARVEDLIPKYLEDANKLTLLSTTCLTEAVKKCIDTNDMDAPIFTISNQEEFILKKLIELQPDEADVDECLRNLQNNRNADDFIKALNDPNRVKTTNAATNAGDDDLVIIDDDDDDSGSSSTPVKPAKGPGSRGGRGSRGGAKGSRGPRGGRGRAK